MDSARSIALQPKNLLLDPRRFAVLQLGMKPVALHVLLVTACAKSIGRDTHHPKAESLHSFHQTTAIDLFFLAVGVIDDAVDTAEGDAEESKRDFYKPLIFLRFL